MPAVVDEEEHARRVSPLLEITWTDPVTDRKGFLVIDRLIRGVCSGGLRMRDGCTLDEVREADILIHVVDISHPGFEDQIKIVENTLFEIEKEEKPTIIVFNKIDAFSYTPKEEDDLTPEIRSNVSLEELEKSWMSKLKENCIFISAKEKENIEELREMIYNKVKEIHITRFPYNDFLFHNYDNYVPEDYGLSEELEESDESESDESND